ncbi:methionyl-tRNA formyltransferase [Candidatus Liberibacter sp.]|uniref:methionyl-tRNA formyltransferase n=1 Tax=Candidatus Liberibacter sp. TaxID=34022 RepID=UPI0015F3A953|nr:methionyl-tRNA formyltransferase [Candidatus Liberibacter sp.]MBA5724261.1 methionyl-tRNA formyltransferase [Candidatus Liberibacter sp.]
MSLRIIFMGTSDFAVSTLRALVSSSHKVIVVYTRPPRPAGRRGLKVIPSKVHQIAHDLNIPIRTPSNFQKSDCDEFFKLDADVAVVVSYGLIIPSYILEVVNLGFYNGHASLLPRWRGASPIQRAIMAGDSETGVAIMKMDAGLDTGPVGLVKQISIHPDMTTGELHDQLSTLCANAMVESMDRLEANNFCMVPQEQNGITYAKKISKSEMRVDFTQSSQEVHNHIRAFSPLPGAWIEIPIGHRVERVKLLMSQLVDGKGEPGEIIGSDFTVACSQGAIRIIRLQKAGGHAPLNSKDFLLGHPLTIGARIR